MYFLKSYSQAQIQNSNSVGAQNYIKLIDKQKEKFISYIKIKLSGEIEIFNKNMDKL